jgi:hypothetical protein
MPYDHEADRELVQQTFSREWGEPVCAVQIREFVPSFKVPGRQANGSPSSQRRVRRFFISDPKIMPGTACEATRRSVSGAGLG